MVEGVKCTFKSCCGRRRKAGQVEAVETERLLG
jgi:hypothetical protein